ncbi:AAA family ATPase [Solidesulfovibrio magneticus]|uniref:ATPase AAA-type core domain-containing protein n=1 Tax=Solidesulfovibrio magneticus (strain ATCC 700980 / DSM 13731 / RS-1) TaxID=573370 RepID=C4XKK3_SOLM1|nr:AAA family ATPase [Solidesulfovibrio magneticus]BAH76943.1 hypothetical protein DMR_34520 [Solidesulfovibrio magneticus RS-1]
MIVKTHTAVFRSTVPGRLSKRFDKSPDGGLEKQPGGQLVQGTYQPIAVEGPAAMVDLLGKLQGSDAMCFGTAGGGKRPIYSRDAAPDADALTRTKDRFDWPEGPGVMLLDNDIDPRPGALQFDMDGFRAALLRACPGLGEAPAVFAHSASSFIYDTDTDRCLKGEGGHHAYVFVKDARDIPRAGKVLADRIWLAGLGYCIVGKDGKILDRCLIDTSVWQPSRLCFSAGASCGGGLEQRRPQPAVINPDATPLDTKARLPELSAEEKTEVARLKAEARKEVEAEAAEVRRLYVASRIAEYRARPGAASEEDVPDAVLERQFRRAVEDNELFSDFLLHCQGGDTITVGEVLRDREKWDGARFCHPTEPTYGNDDRIAWADLRPGRPPTIHSFAHGGCVFRLFPYQEIARLQDGGLPAVVEQAERVLARDGETFQRAGLLVRVVGGMAVQLKPSVLRNSLEKLLRFEKWSGTHKRYVAKDCPDEVSRRLIEGHGTWRYVQELHGVVRGPILRPDGTALASAGHDEATGLLITGDDQEWPTIPAKPTRDQVRTALAELLEPFGLYKFASPLDAAACLCLLLTAVQRPILPTAPGFIVEASTPGTGKTKLAQAVGWLGGAAVPASPWADNAEEQRKNLVAALRGAPHTLLFDNIDRPLGGAALAAVLTGSTFEDRLLGASDRVTVPTNTVLIFSANNPEVLDDVNRRLLRIRIEPGCENPHERPFPFDPVARVRERWLALRVAALTVMRGFYAAGAPRQEGKAVGSYEEWDNMIRQCVCWINNDGLCEWGLDDPAKCIEANWAADAGTRRLGTVLKACRVLFGDASFKASDIISPTGSFDSDEAAETGETTADEEAVEAKKALHAVLPEIAADIKGGINTKRLGKWLGRSRGRIVEGLRFESSGVLDGSQVWAVRRAA